MNDALDEIKALLVKNNELLEQGIVLTKRLITLFEKYDADVFQEEEIKRDLQNGLQRPPRRAGSSG